jgi:predicted signal transduction protein with EAL and GGDEF domain
MDADDAAIAAAVILLVHSMNMMVIAEGVETEGQFAFLDTLGCDEVQGYYLGKPMSPTDFERQLKRERILSPAAPRPASESMRYFRHTGKKHETQRNAQIPSVPARLPLAV